MLETDRHRQTLVNEIKELSTDFISLQEAHQELKLCLHVRTSEYIRPQLAEELTKAYLHNTFGPTVNALTLLDANFRQDAKTNMR